MRRLPWILCVILIVALTIEVTNRVARAQIIFPDQTLQTTAFTEGRSVPTGANVVRTRVITGGTAPLALSLDTVPADRELVILKMVGWNTPLATLESRLPAPNQNNLPITLAVMNRELADDNSQFTMEFPDGAVVVDEGRQPWLVFRNPSNFNETNSPGATVSAMTMIGYLRLKP